MATAPNTLNLKLLPHQMKFIQSDKLYTVLCAGRSAGKSYIAAWLVIKYLMEGRNVICAAQNYKAVERVLFKAVLGHFATMGVEPRVNRTKLEIEFNGATAYFYTSEIGSVDAVRGLTDISALILDEAALASKEFLDVAVACLRGKNVGMPHIYMMSTPRGGQNFFSRIIRETRPEDIEVIHATSRDNTNLDEHFFRSLENLYSGDFARQELLGQILDNDAEDQVFPSSVVNRAMSMTNLELLQESGRPVFSIDMSRFGSDSTSCWARKGRRMKRLFKVQKADSFNLFDRVVQGVRPYLVEGQKRSVSIHLDGTGGFASGLADLLRKAGYLVREFNFSGQAVKDPNHYSNLRAYMYTMAAEAFRRGLMVENDDKVREELLSVRYFIDNLGKRRIIPKDEIKGVLGRSPDDADAIALSFATGSLDDPFAVSQPLWADKRSIDNSLADIENSYGWHLKEDATAW